MIQKVSQPKIRNKKKFIAIMLVLLLVIVGASTWYYQNHKLKWAETTSKSKTAQSNYSEGEDRPTDVPNGGSQGGAIDNNGKLPVDPDEPVPTKTSPDGQITVNGLTDNSVISSGDNLYGVSKVTGPVYFRIIDESSGVIAQGQLNVVNGVFSGKLSFTPRSVSGRLDLYSTDSMGAEINNMEIPVQFK